MNAVVLLAEDDPVSRAFLAEALATLGLDCDAVDDGLAALRRASERRYDALLLDLNLPGCDGDGILAALRGDASAASHEAPALVLTADDAMQTAQRLRSMGFDGVANKPLGIERLAMALHALGLPVATMPSAEDKVTGTADIAGAAPVWDDAQALSAAGGNQEIVIALRGMMRTELPLQRATIVSAHSRGDAGSMRAELHRLRASCGFCGAAALALSTETLQEALLGQRDVPGSFERFLADVDRLLAVS